MSGKTRLIADESIGGVQREYVEVERKADVGDYVVVIAENMLGENHFECIYKCTGLDGDLIDTDGKWCDGSVLNIDDTEYKTLEPTDIVHIEGKRYRLVDRKAEVGEDVLIVNGGGWYSEEVGERYTMIDGSEFGYEPSGSFYVYVEHPENREGEICCVTTEDYLVLEPVADATIADEGTTVDARHASPEVVDLLANLARRVTSLENKLGSVEAQLADTQGNVEKLAQELATKTHEQSELIEMALDDIVTLDERTGNVPKLEKKIDHIITYDLGWKRMGPGRIPEIESKISDVKFDIKQLTEKLDEILAEVDGSERP